MKSTMNYKQIDTGQYFSTSPRGQKNIAHISQAEACLLVAVVCLPVACSLLLVAFSLAACLLVACSLLLVAFFLSPFRPFSLSTLSRTPYSLHPTASLVEHILFSIKNVNYARLSLSLSLSLSCARTRVNFA
jgi:hypothetical protein